MLISRLVLLEKEKSIADLRSRIRELRARHEYERRVSDQRNREEVNRLETQRKNDLERENRQANEVARNISGGEGKN